MFLKAYTATLYSLFEQNVLLFQLTDVDAKTWVWNNYSGQRASSTMQSRGSGMEGPTANEVPETFWHWDLEQGYLLLKLQFSHLQNGVIKNHFLGGSEDK